MANISGLREQILANCHFINPRGDEIDIIVSYNDTELYRAFFTENASASLQILTGAKPASPAKTVEQALANLLDLTCAVVAELSDVRVDKSPDVDEQLAELAVLNAASVQEPTTIIGQQPAKRRPGRPKKSDVFPAVGPPAPKRGIGRPKKSDATVIAKPSAEGVTKRTPGRPRKNRVAAAVSADASAAPAKRGRGRPRKSDITIATAPPTNATKRSASLIEEPAAALTLNKSRKSTHDAEEAGETAPFTPQVWFPTYVTRLAKVVYHCLAEATPAGLTEEEVAERTGLPLMDVFASVRQLKDKGGISLVDDDTHDGKWTIVDEWEDED